MSSMLDPRLAHQSRARPLTAPERALATVLEDIFKGGVHDFAAVASALQSRGVLRPSGATEAWTAATLDAELKTINASLDTSYQHDGIGV